MFTVRRLTTLALCGLFAVALLVAACGDSAEAPTGDGANGGLTPSDGADGDSPTGEATDDSGSQADGFGPLTLIPDGFGDGDAIPELFTCDGDDTSPGFSWSGAPERTRAFALIVDDPDAPAESAFVHFLVYDLPGGETELEAGIPVPSHPQAGGFQGRNDFGRTGWGGPCPPEGDGPHGYVFALYALNEKLGLDAGATKEQVLAAAAGHVLGVVELTATYER